MLKNKIFLRNLLFQFKEKRERSAEPYRERKEELRERLEIVRVQLTAANSSRRVRSSSTNLTATTTSMLDVRFSPGKFSNIFFQSLSTNLCSSILLFQFIMD